MLRISTRLRPHVTSRVVRGRGGGGVGRRFQSSQSGRGGVGNGLLVVAGSSTFVAGLVGYAAWSDDNRRKVERGIPGSSYVLSGLLGPLAEKPPVTEEQGLLKKKLDREKKKKPKEVESAPAPAVEEVKPGDAVVESLSPPASSEETQQQGGSEDAPEHSTESAPLQEVTPDPAVPVDAAEVTTSPPVPEEKPAVISLEERLASSEVSQDVENAALSQALQDLAYQAQKELTGALSAAEDAARVVQQHAEKAYQAIDGAQDKEQFEAVAELAVERNRLVEDAHKRIAAAGEAVEKFREQVSEGQQSGLTKENPALIAAEETLVEMKYAVDKARGMILEAERDSKVVSSYKALVEAGREQFEAEVRSLLPEVKLGETSDKLTQDELNLLLAHAHRKVLHMQTQLARLQTMEHDRFKEALARQRSEDSQLLEAKVETELDRQRQQLDVEYKKRVMDMKEELEGELRSQLKRQAAAHSDHLADVLYVQEKDLENKWSSILQDKVQSEKDTYLSSLAKIQGQLHGLQSALAMRADVDKAALSARELWLACESLRNALRNSGEGAPSWEEQLKPLQDHISAIRKASGGDSNPYVEAVLASLGEDAVGRGVYPEEALRERFIKVERVCKRVAMIGDNGGSLLRYLLSYIQSFLVLDAFEYLPGSEVRNEEVAVDSLSIYDILARARYCLEKDDLCMSVRYMNLLRGEARNVASGWLKEARLTLETRQAAYALLAHAAATAVQAL
ncbi:MICOS complex subunit MIC60-like isoform X2 [Portunus trituberculatus]|uniref:MICOS complex subunit MIC60-like isoform X2 n=1 Tax=Portunus trituberculatus TaxID=210409 RepID=UPI001E1CEEF4|nr:MICOS complex subunit MIC60-like isoform X2 [Portunus trituberculatus]